MCEGVWQGARHQGGDSWSTLDWYKIIWCSVCVLGVRLWKARQHGAWKKFSVYASFCAWDIVKDSRGIGSVNSRYNNLITSRISTTLG